MKKKTKILISLSLVFNLICIIIAGILIYQNEQRKIFRPYLSTYYLSKKSLYEVMNNKRGGIVFLGDSLTDRCNWSELLNNNRAINRGINGDTTGGVLKRLDSIIRLKPQKIFIMVGGNDFIVGRSTSSILVDYHEIIDTLHSALPGTQIYIQSLLPTLYRKVPIPRQKILDLNNGLKHLADQKKIFYIDIYSHMADKNHDLKSEYTIDGAHMNGKGYLVWKKVITPYLR